VIHTVVYLPQTLVDTIGAIGGYIVNLGDSGTRGVTVADTIAEVKKVGSAEEWKRTGQYLITPEGTADLVVAIDGALAGLPRGSTARPLVVVATTESIAAQVAGRLRVSVKDGITTVFDPKSGTSIAGMGSGDGVFVINVVVDPALRGNGVSVELYRRLISELGGDTVKSVRGTPAGANLEAVWADALETAPRVRALEHLGFKVHSTDGRTYILSERP